MTLLKFSYPFIAKLTNMLFMVLFVYTATSKLLTFDYFELQLSRMPLISVYSAYLVWMVPCIEYIIVILLLFPKHVRSAYYLSLGLLTGFTSYLIWVLNSGKSVPCSCGGVLTTLSWKAHILFNMTCMAMAVVSILILNHQKNNLYQNHFCAESGEDRKPVKKSRSLI